ncbi:hypothetical protein Vadar_012885 [Vaccinium darrowii]|uniref:Uncharacterized protein n=1 Tax=Vaccinium darrowii TaxID=229202 RepID=A0ACB7X036_9ERIC|nr:hypothetical protein Vadar_012885 [Vaccinium darrowii]
MAKTKSKAKPAAIEKTPAKEPSKPPHTFSESESDEDGIAARATKGIVIHERGPAPKKRKTRQVREESESESSIDSDEESEEESPKTKAGRSKMVKKKQAKAKKDKKKKEWLESLTDRPAKNERQVDAVSLEGKYGVKEIREEGLEQWLEPLRGYNLRCVREFYKNLDVVRSGDSNMPTKIRSKVSNKTIVVTPDTIAEYLQYERPDPEDTNYPDGEEMPETDLLDIIYANPGSGMRPILPSRFKEDIRVLNKAIHANLYPKGKDSKPTKTSLELIAAFVDPGTVADWALYIFTQMIDFTENTKKNQSMWYPCMITALCHMQGVRGATYSNMEPLEPGVIDMGTVNQSLGQTRTKLQRRKLGGLSTMFEASSSQAPPPAAPARSRLHSPPPKGASVKAWVKKLFKCMVVESEKNERHRKREEHKTDWLIQQVSATSVVQYVPPPEYAEPEVVDDDDDDDDDDE